MEGVRGEAGPGEECPEMKVRKGDSSSVRVILHRPEIRLILFPCHGKEGREGGERGEAEECVEYKVKVKIESLSVCPSVCSLTSE